MPGDGVGRAFYEVVVMASALCAMHPARRSNRFQFALPLTTARWKAHEVVHDSACRTNPLTKAPAPKDLVPFPGKCSKFTGQVDPRAVCATGWTMHGTAPAANSRSCRLGRV
jgi:hypothetical protein